MALGDSIISECSSLSTQEADLIDWHLDSGTSANWLADTFRSCGINIGTTTLKDFRRRIDRKPLGGVEGGIVNAGLYTALLEKKAFMEDAFAKTIRPKIVTLDIERLPGVFKTEFWSLNDMKGRRIHPDWVEAYPRTICFAYKWLDEQEVHFSSEWDHGHDEMIRMAWEVFDEADYIVGHNVGRFDAKNLRSEWFESCGLHDPSPFRTIDTLRIARDKFNFESNTLDALCKRMGVDAKTDKYSKEIAWAAVNGDPEAQERIKGYNIGDIYASEGLYLKFRDRGYIHNHPVMAPGMPMRCRACGGGNLAPMEKPVIPGTTMSYSLYRCADCHTQQRFYRGTRASSLQGVKSI